MTDLIIADSTCLIGLERIDKIDLLPQMYSLIGTVGILVKAKQLGLIDQLLTILEALENKGFYLSQSLKTEALILVGET